MNSVRNNVQILGNLGQDPQVITTESGKKIARFSIAATESYTDAKGQRIQNTHWFRVVAWEGVAASAEKKLSKGSKVVVHGKLSTNNWTDKNGVKHNDVVIVASEFVPMEAVVKE
ncbi:MAG: single-stranded DNA-binding protein [Bacteroidetes bacterium]|jgi:single-strand DNA-binding protein|nr:single-stranded DNA-binding protein [Bacteroidota bacterium]